MNGYVGLEERRWGYSLNSAWGSRDAVGRGNSPESAISYVQKGKTWFSHVKWLICRTVSK